MGRAVASLAALIALSSTLIGCGGDGDSDTTTFDFTGVTDVFSNKVAFLALNKNQGAGQCWGDVDNGGSCDAVQFTGVTDVFSTNTAFLALNKDNGTGQCW